MSHRRVLVLFEYAALNGGEWSFLAVAPYLQAAGFDLSALLIEEGPLKARLEESGIDVQMVPGLQGTGQVAKRSELAALFQSQEPGLVHANSLSMTRLSAPVAREMGIPHLGHLRDIANVSRQTLEDLSKSNRLIAVSSAVKQSYELLGLAGQRIHVLHNGVDLKCFSPGDRLGAFRDKLGIGERPLIVGIGQLSLRKGFDVWLSAAECIARKMPECRFVIAGQQHSQKPETVEYVRALQKRSTTNSLAGRVDWLGRCDQIAELLKEADLLMHTARQEPLGRVLLEAMAVGAPIVATRVGGAEEILPPEDHESMLVEAGDAEGIAAAAMAILTSASKQADIRERFPRWAAEKFSAARSGAGLADHYRAVYDGTDGYTD
jgi:glycosyltransferase involved in cell wall biosynthesis